MNKFTPLFLLALAITTACQSPIVEESNPQYTENQPTVVEESPEEAEWVRYEGAQFSLEFPAKWTAEDIQSEGKTVALSFNDGTPYDNIGGVDSFTIDLETEIAEIGDQFDDRIETRENVTLNNGEKALLVTVTTPSIEDWMAKVVFVETAKEIYAIRNGSAIEDDVFERIYKSFEAVNAESSSTWKNYTGYGFSIDYPAEQSISETPYGILFMEPGQLDHAGGVRQETEPLEELIAKMGDQFEDRVENRQTVTLNSGEEALLVTVTTPSIEDWEYKMVFIQNGGALYSIGDAALGRADFEALYKSFQLTQ